MRIALAPGTIVRGPGALAELGALVAALGARPLLVHGEAGFALVADRLRVGLAAAGVAATETRHAGPVTAAAIDRLAQIAMAGEHDVVIGVGGGRVLDAAKGAADGVGAADRVGAADGVGAPDHVGAPFIAVPTSPATCAATTAMSVLYDRDGAWSGPRFVRACPDLVVLDATLLGAAPDRLLAAGVLDALCKVEEVRLAARTGPEHDAFLDAALALCDALAGRVDPATGALRSGLPHAPAERAALAEAVVVLPGLVAGLAGEGQKLAAAHAVHNALTRVPGQHRALHGEQVGFGMLVQALLDGADDAALTVRVGWMARLGVDASLASLGCRAYLDEPAPILAWLVEAPALRRAFPRVREPELAAAIARADRIASRAGLGAPSERR